jgi:hypothetical protein
VGICNSDTLCSLWGTSWGHRHRWWSKHNIRACPTINLKSWVWLAVTLCCWVSSVNMSKASQYFSFWVISVLIFTHFHYHDFTFPAASNNTLFRVHAIQYLALLACHPLWPPVTHNYTTGHIFFGYMDILLELHASQNKGATIPPITTQTTCPPPQRHPAPVWQPQISWLASTEAQHTVATTQR